MHSQLWCSTVHPSLLNPMMLCMQNFGPGSSLNMADVPLHSSAIFPIVEEPNGNGGMYRDISSRGELT